MFSYGLLWLFILASTVSLLVSVVALSAGRKWRPARFLWPLLVFVLTILFLSASTLLAYVLKDEGLRPTWLFPYCWTMTVLYIICSVLVFRWRKGSVVGEKPWSKGRWVVAFFVFFILSTITITQISNNVRIRAANMRSTATAEVVQMLAKRPSPGQNAVDYYRKAFQAMGAAEEYSKQSETVSYLNGLDIESPIVIDDKAEEALADSREALTMLRAAGKMPGFYYEINVKNLVASQIPQYSNYRNAARLLALSSAARVQAGDYDGALEDIETMESMVNQLRNQPFLISLMMSAAIDEDRVDALNNMLNQADGLTFSPGPGFGEGPSFQDSLIDTWRIEQAAMIQAFCIATESPNLSFELLMIHPVFFDENNPIGLLTAPLATTVMRAFLVPADLDSAPEFWGRIQEDLSQPYYIANKRYKEPDLGSNEDRGGIFTAIAVPSYNRLHLQVARADARRALALAALALKGYYSEHGMWPESLDNLSPDIIRSLPVDPFDGEPIKMKVEGDEIILSSVGTEEKWIKSEPVGEESDEASDKKRRKKSRSKKVEKPIEFRLKIQ